MYTAFVLTDSARTELLQKFRPKYNRVYAHHVTERFGVGIDTPVPYDSIVSAYAHIDTEDGLELLLVSVDGRNKRPDGGTYHITWSLNPDLYKPVDSNKVITEMYEQGGPALSILGETFRIETVPSLLR